MCAIDVNSGTVQIGITPLGGPIRTSLETILIALSPREVLFERGNLDSDLVGVIKRHVGAKCCVGLLPVQQFLDYGAALTAISKYHSEEDVCNGATLVCNDPFPVTRGFICVYNER